MSIIDRSSEPLYLLVKKEIDNRIEKGTYTPGERLPSEAELAEEFGVSRATLREALRVLEKEGKVDRRQGIGTFIAEKRAQFKSGIEELNSLTEMIEARGLEPGTKDIELNLNQQVPQLAKEFEFAENAKMIILHRTRTADGKAVAFCTDYLPHQLLPIGKVKKSYFQGSLFKHLRDECGIYPVYAVADIVPEVADGLLAEKLNLEKGASILLLSQMYYDDCDNPILYSKNYFRSDKFKFHVMRTRN